MFNHINDKDVSEDRANCNGNHQCSGEDAIGQGVVEQSLVDLLADAMSMPSDIAERRSVRQGWNIYERRRDGRVNGQSAGQLSEQNE